MEKANFLNIDLSKLNYAFQAKPLLIGGKAMEYYQLRNAGADIDFVICTQDYQQLAAHYPDHLKDLFGDLGVCIDEFELWQTILLFDYDFLSIGAVEDKTIKIISLEKLLFLKALIISEPKNAQDAKLIVDKIRSIQYGHDQTYDSSYFQR